MSPIESVNFEPSQTVSIIRFQDSVTKQLDQKVAQTFAQYIFDSVFEYLGRSLCAQILVWLKILNSGHCKD